jgi:hypothetical protein
MHPIQYDPPDLWAVVEEKVAAKNQVKIPVDARRGAYEALIEQVVAGEIDPFLETLDNLVGLSLHPEILEDIL